METKLDIVEFYFDNDLIAQIQQDSILNHVLTEATGVTIAPNDWLDGKVDDRSWLCVSRGHIHDDPMVFTTFTFFARPGHNFTEHTGIVEAATFDMYTWLDERGIGAAILPHTVVFVSRSEEGRSTPEDFTEHATQLLGQLASSATIKPEDFNN